MERLKELRLERGLTQKQVGDAMGVNDKTIGQYERGDRQPDFAMLRKLCEYFCVTADYMLGWVDI